MKLTSRGPRTALALMLLQLLAMACAVPSFVSDGLNLNGLNRVAGIVATPPSFDIGPTPTPVPETVSTAALVRQRKKLRVGIRYDAPPLASINGQGELEGFDVDLARELARRWLGSPNAIEFVQVTSNSAPRKVAAREIDLALGGIAATGDARLLADFSQPYLEDGEALLIRKGSYPDFKSMAREGITYVDADTTFALRDAQNAAGVTVTLTGLNSYPAAFSALRAGTTEGVAGKLRRLRAEAQRDPNAQVLTVFRRDPIGIVVPPDDSDWADLTNLTLNAMIADNTFNLLHKKWFGVEANTPPALADPVKMDLSALPDTLTKGNTIAKLRAKQRLDVGFNPQASPMSSLVKDAPAGFEVDIAREFAKRWFGKPDAVKFVALTRNKVGDALRQGQVDLAVGDIGLTQANEFNFDLSAPIYQSGLGLLVMKSSRITDVVRLNGQTVGLLGISPAQMAGPKKARNLTFNEASLPDGAAALAALRAKQVIAIAGDRVALFGIDRGTTDTIMVRDQLSESPIALALTDNDSAFRNLVNLTLSEMVTDGTFAVLYRKWFDEPARYLPPKVSGESIPANALLNP